VDTSVALRALDSCDERVDDDELATEPTGALDGRDSFACMCYTTSVNSVISPWAPPLEGGWGVWTPGMT